MFMKIENKTKKVTKREWISVFLLFLFFVVFRTLIAGFDKSLETYPDELRYYDLARSLFEENGMAIRNSPADFQKIAYALFILPVFAVEDIVVRLQLIGLVNSILICSSVFPIYLIATELELSKGLTYFSVVLTLLFPDMVLSATLMSEILYWPILLWFIYLWLLNQRKRKVTIAIFQGVLAYVGYLCKEIFLAVLIACVLFEILNFFLDMFENGKAYAMKNNCNRQNIGVVLVLMLTFGMIFVGAKGLFFGDMGSSYNHQTGFSAILTSYNFIYMMYGFVYYITAVFVATLFFPIVYPLINFRHLDRKIRGLFCFVILFLLVSLATVAYTITVREDLGLVVPRVHLRYVEPVFIVLLMIFFSFERNVSENSIKDNKLNSTITVTSVLLMVLLIFKGVSLGSAVDQFSLAWYQFFQERIGKIFAVNGNDMVIYLYAVVVGVCVAIVVGILHALYLFRTPKAMKSAFGIVLLIVCLSNNYLTMERIYGVYQIQEDMQQEILKINEYFEENANEANVLYFTESDYINKKSKVMDTYFDNMDNLYMVDDTYFSELTSKNELSDMVLKETIWDKVYEDVNTIDYIIVEDEGMFGMKALDNVVEMEEISGEHFIVYKNLEPTNITLTVCDEFDIFFAGADYNANKYDITGISTPEEHFTWTDGDVMNVDIPWQSEGRIRVTIYVMDTFNGQKSFEILQDSNVLKSGELSGAGEIVFEVVPNGGNISFRMNMPDSQVVSEVFDSTDTRKIAFQLQKMSIETIEED